MRKFFKILLVVLATAFYFSACYKNFVADIYYRNAEVAVEKLSSNEDISRALDNIEKAIKSNPNEPNYYRMQARIYVLLLPSKDGEIKKMIKKIIIQNLEKAYKINPSNLVTIRNIIPLYYFVAAADISTVAGSANVDPEFLPVAKAFYANVKNVSPNDAGVYALVARYEKRLGLNEEYKASVEKVRELRPDLLEWYDSFR